MSVLSSESIHVVSLSSALDRRKHIRELFGAHGIPFSFFDAVHGKNAFGEKHWPWFYDPVALQNKGISPLSLGDLGCAASHIMIWEQLVASKDEAWMIFEDDIILSKQVNLPSLQEVIQSNGSEGITLLNHVSIFGYRAGRVSLPLMGGESRFPIWGNTFTGAYAIGRRAAAVLLEYLRKEKLSFAIDTWGSYKTGAFGFCHLVPVRVVLPPPAHQSFNFTSSITEMGRQLVLNDNWINQSGRIRWKFGKGFFRTLWFWIKGNMETFRRPKNLVWDKSR